MTCPMELAAPSALDSVENGWGVVLRIRLISEL